MNRKINISSFSQRFFFLTVFVYLLDFSMGGKLGILLALNPAVVITKQEFWQLITFPFVMGSWESLALFAFTFFMIAPKLEKQMPKGLFPLILLLSLFLQSTALTLAFWKREIAFSGMEGLSFFVLSLYVFLNLSRQRTYYYSPFRSVIFTLLVVMLWFSSVLLRSFFFGSELMGTALGLALFGIGTGGLTYLQILMARKLHKMKKQQIDPSAYVPPKEVKYAEVTQVENDLNAFTVNSKIVQSSDISVFIPDEDRLNQILDKISEHGKESLLPDELQYLEDYSKQL